MSKNKKIVIIITSIFIIIGICYIVVSQLYIIKPNIVKSEKFYCSPDNCASMDGKQLNGVVDIYSGIASKEKCIEINGSPILAWGIAGQEMFQGCGVK